MPKKQLRTILVLWFLLLCWLAHREGDWWEDRLAKYLEKSIKISFKPKPMPYVPVELPHPSREAAQIPFVREFDNYAATSSSVLWRDDYYGSMASGVIVGTWRDPPPPTKIFIWAEQKFYHQPSGKWVPEPWRWREAFVLETKGNMWKISIEDDVFWFDKNNPQVKWKF